MMNDDHPTRILTAEDILAVVRSVGPDRFMDMVIEGIRSAAAQLDGESTLTMARAGFQYSKPELGLIEWMPSMELGRAVAIKTVGYHPNNPSQRGLPSVLATTTINDTSTGKLLALVDATLLTAIRTGAASAVATDILAIENSRTLGIVGAGAQAVTQIHAISRVRPIDRVVAFDTNPAVSASLAERMPSNIPVEIVDDIAAIAVESDIIVTATTVDIGAGAVLPSTGYRPHVHVNAVGSDFPGKVELPLDFLQSAMVVPDDIEQCLQEGECQQLERNEVGPDLSKLLKNADRYHCQRRSTTVFDSTGWSLEDLIVAEIALHEAERLGLGVSTSLQSTPADPYSPYEGLLQP